MTEQRVLVAYGSAHGSTAGIAGWIGEALRERGFAVDVEPAGAVTDVSSYDAVVLGGALYAGRWHKDARRFARRLRRDLSARPVWLFSSGPLDDSAETTDIAPTRAVAHVMERLGARDHATFGGSIADNDNFMARSMAKNLDQTDFRNRHEVVTWASGIALALTEPART